MRKLGLFALVVLLVSVMAAEFSTRAAAANYVRADVNLRTGPGVRYRVKAVIPIGSRIFVQRCQRSWCKIRWTRRTGWINRRYIARTQYRPRYEPPIYHPPVYIDPPFYRGRPRYDRPRRPRPRYDRPRRPRPKFDRPRRPRPKLDRPRKPRPRLDRPRRPRPKLDRPRKPRPKLDRPRRPQPKLDRPPRRKPGVNRPAAQGLFDGSNSR